MTRNTIQRLLSALPCEAYEIGIRSEKTDMMMLREWTAETLLSSKTIGFLKAKNANIEHIYIRPKSPHCFTLLDDLSASSIDKMKWQGFNPCLVVQTSPNNYQAWLNHGQPLDNQLSTYVAQSLARQFDADPSSADFRHFGRLPGFTNVKPKYYTGIFYPFVKIISAINAVYEKAEPFINDSKKEFKTQQALTKKVKKIPAVDNFQPLSKSLDDFYNNTRYENDQHRADLAFSIYAINHGMSESELHSILSNVRDLTKKGNVKRQGQYVDRTIAKAKSFGA